jgi:hypothetical protein
MTTSQNVLEVLAKSPLTSREVEAKLKEAGHTYKSVPVVLSTLKTQGKVTFDEAGGPWRLTDAAASAVTVPEGMTIIDAMLAEIAKKPLTFDALGAMFGDSAKSALQNLVRAGKVTNDGRGKPWRVTNGHGKALKAGAAKKAAKGSAKRVGIYDKLLAALEQKPLTHAEIKAKFGDHVSTILARLKTQGKVDNDGPRTAWYLTPRKKKGRPPGTPNKPSPDGPITDQVLAEISREPQTLVQLRKRFGDNVKGTLNLLSRNKKITQDSRGAPWRPAGAASPKKRSSVGAQERLVDKAFRKGDDPLVNVLVAKREYHIKKVAQLDAAILAMVEDE